MGLSNYLDRNVKRIYLTTSAVCLGASVWGFSTAGNYSTPAPMTRDVARVEVIDSALNRNIPTKDLIYIIDYLDCKGIKDSLSALELERAVLTSPKTNYSAEKSEYDRKETKRQINLAVRAFGGVAGLALGLGFLFLGIREPDREREIN